MQLYEELWNERLNESKINQDIPVASRLWTKEILEALKYFIERANSEYTKTGQRTLNISHYQQTWRSSDEEQKIWEYMPKTVDGELQEITVHIRFLQRPSSDYFFTTISGDAIVEDGKINIYVVFRYPRGRRDFQEVKKEWLSSDSIRKLYGTLVHEIYHLFDKEAVIASLNDYASSDTRTPEEFKQYYIQPVEARAYVTEIYWAAKRTKKSFLSFLNNEFRQLLDNGLSSVAPEIYYDRRKRYRFTKSIRASLLRAAKEMGYIK